jgi:flagellin-like hook-associated protein FlgL
MKVIGYSLVLSLILFTISACESKNNKVVNDNSQVSMLNEQISALENDLSMLRKEVADAPEIEMDLEKIAAMSDEERMANEDVRINYVVKKDVIIHQLMNMVEEIKIQKNIANESNDSNLAMEYDKLLSRISEFQAELGVEQNHSDHSEHH